MKNQDKFIAQAKKIRRLALFIFATFMVMVSFLLYLFFDPTLSTFQTTDSIQVYNEVETSDEDFDKIENGIHVRTGFVEGEGLMLVVNNCTNCHSAKLVTQNRMGKEQWLATIRWMQETQNLWDLGQNEEVIVNYLATYYAPKKGGRRKNLEHIDWYELKVQ